MVLELLAKVIEAEKSFRLRQSKPKSLNSQILADQVNEQLESIKDVLDCAYLHYLGALDEEIDFSVVTEAFRKIIDAISIITATPVESDASCREILEETFSHICEYEKYLQELIDFCDAECSERATLTDLLMMVKYCSCSASEMLQQDCDVKSSSNSTQSTEAEDARLPSKLHASQSQLSIASMPRKKFQFKLPSWKRKSPTDLQHLEAENVHDHVASSKLQSDQLFLLFLQLAAVTANGYSVREVATMLVMFRRKQHSFKLKPTFVGEARSWYENTVEKLQSKLTRRTKRSRGVQYKCWLSNKTIRSALVAEAGHKQAAFERCYKTFVDAVKLLTTVYSSLEPTQISACLKDNDLETIGTGNVQVYEGMNRLVVDQFVEASAAHHFNEQQFLSIFQDRYKTHSQYVRCVMAQYGITSRLASELIGDAHSKEYNYFRLRVMFKLVQKYPLKSLKEISAMMVSCAVCKLDLADFESSSLPCKCVFCMRCLVSHYETAFQNNALEDLSCPSCKRPAAFGEAFQQHLEFLHTHLRSQVNLVAQEQFDNLMIERAVKLSERRLVTCDICIQQFMESEMYAMYVCNCKICLTCTKQIFSDLIAQKPVSEWSCCMCQKPSSDDRESLENHIWYLCETLRYIMDVDVYEMAQSKIAEWAVRNDGQFRWCKCGNGFLWNEPDERKTCMTCPTCKRSTCFKCEKEWEEQHYGITCEQFEKWKIDNDPNYQKQGLDEYIKDKQITCSNPRCQVKYELARGGCLHFKCRYCDWEFCGFCGARYLKGSECKRFESCDKRGLHAHCLPNCLSFLRDWEVGNLQNLLDNHKVDYTGDGGGEENAEESPCEVILQSEEGADHYCGQAFYASLDGESNCLVHYKEYLVRLIKNNQINV